MNFKLIILSVILLSVDKLDAQYGDGVDNEEVEQVQMQTTDDYDYEEPVQQHEQQVEEYAKLVESPQSERMYVIDNGFDRSNASFEYRIDLKEITDQSQT